MRVKEKWRISAFIRAAKALGPYTMIIRLPVAMADLDRYPGADRWTMAAVYPYDGRAVVVPSSQRCGILVCDWAKLMRFVRRHNLA